jgi:hypothetical protein
MGRLRQILIVQFLALCALVIFGVVLAMAAALKASMDPSDVFGPGGAAWITFGYTATLGFFPVVLLCAPTYWILLGLGHARWYFAVAIGIVPGLLFSLGEQRILFWPFVTGFAVALIAHALCRKYCSNYSLKRTNQSLRD